MRPCWGSSTQPGRSSATSSIRSAPISATPAVRVVLGFNETVATLVKNDLLDRDLVFDWLWMAGTWDRVGPAAVRAREQAGAPNLYENFEMLAAQQPPAHR
jgi:hypothetical protein